MDDNYQLSALSPLDGRYQSKVSVLASKFSEGALIKYRLKVEILYLVALAEEGVVGKLPVKDKQLLLKVIDNCDQKEIEKIKEIEETTKHDVKAIEYYLRDTLKTLSVNLGPFIHFGLTSEDINTISYSLSIKEALHEVILPTIKKLIETITLQAKGYKRIPMLARTHGQPAVPTTVGKELVIFAVRLAKEYYNLNNLPIEAKLNGAVGNYNAHQIAFPDKNWIAFSKKFIGGMGLATNLYTTQILPSDSYIKIFQSLSLINTILIGFDQDVWRYISDDYFQQQVVKDQVGSSTMPQKVNPIDFENSEGNLGLANANLIFLTEKLAVSRLQRDLSDSTVKRNIGSAYGYCLLGYLSCMAGLSKIYPNKIKLRTELNDHWEIITEGIQTMLRTTNDDQAYEKLKEFSRGRKLTQEAIITFIAGSDMGSRIKTKLSKLSPENYIGLATILTSKALTVINKLVK